MKPVMHRPSWVILLAGAATYYVVLQVSAWLGRTVGPWFLIVLAFGTLVVVVTYLVVGELRDRKQLNEPWAPTWWCER